MQRQLNDFIFIDCYAMFVRILYPRNVATVCLRVAERAGELKSLIGLQVAKWDEPGFFACLVLLCCSAPRLNGPAATNSRHPPSVLSRPNVIMGKYSQTHLCGGVCALQSRSNDPSDRVH
jgi:hypothetical protein